MPRAFTRADPWTLILCFIILLVIAIAFWGLLDAVILALTAAIVLMPAHRRFVHRMTGAGSAALITFLTFLVVTGVFIFTAGIVVQNADFISEIVATIITGVDEIPANRFISPADVAELLSEIAIFLEEFIRDLAIETPFLLLKVFIFFMSLVLFLYSGDRVKQEVMAVLPEQLAIAVERLSAKIYDTLYAFYVVEVAVAFITFIIAIPFFFFWGYGNVLFFSLLVGLFQLLPFLGPQLVILLLAAWAVAQGDLFGALVMLFIGYPLISGVQDFYLRPRMMGTRAAVNPVLMVIGIFGGLALLGVLGLIFGPLLMALLVVSYQIILDQLRIRKREGPSRLTDAVSEDR
jgi:predicted PurR-regulated permease PerM